MQSTLALFTHGQFGAARAARWIGLMLVEGKHFAMNTGSVSLLGIDPHHPAVQGHGLRATFASIAEEVVSGGVLKRMMNHAGGGDVTIGHYVGKS